MDTLTWTSLYLQEEMERFPLELVREPTAVTNRDSRDVYNNIILFTVADDGQRVGGNAAEMHIFHVLGKPVSGPKFTAYSSLIGPKFSVYTSLIHLDALLHFSIHLERNILYFLTLDICRKDKIFLCKNRSFCL